jgi:hypothetical protein
MDGNAEEKATCKERAPEDERMTFHISGRLKFGING